MLGNAWDLYSQNLTHSIGLGWITRLENPNDRRLRYGGQHSIGTSVGCDKSIRSDLVLLLPPQAPRHRRGLHRRTVPYRIWLDDFGRVVSGLASEHEGIWQEMCTTGPKEVRTLRLPMIWGSVACGERERERSKREHLIGTPELLISCYISLFSLADAFRLGEGLVRNQVIGSAIQHQRSPGRKGMEVASSQTRPSSRPSLDYLPIHQKYYRVGVYSFVLRRA